jgi:hypothetical protein
MRLTEIDIDQVKLSVAHPALMMVIKKNHERLT